MSHLNSSWFAFELQKESNEKNCINTSICIQLTISDLKISLITNTSLVIGCLGIIASAAVIWQTSIQLQSKIYVY